MDESGKVIANWDAAAARIYNEICVEEVNAHNRSQHFLNAEGYANLIMKFKERTGRTYTRDQMKNRWNTLKRMYIQWEILNERATGLGRDPHTGSISATDEWWARQNEVSLFVKCMCVIHYKYMLRFSAFHIIACLIFSLCPVA